MRVLGASVVLILGLWPWFLHRAPKFFGISWVIGVSFVLMRQLLVDSRMEAGHQRVQTMIRSLELSALAPFSREGRGTGNGVIISRAYMMKPPKSPIIRGLESFQVGEHIKVLGEWQAPKWSSTPLPTNLALCLFSCCFWVITFYNKLVIQ